MEREQGRGQAARGGAQGLPEVHRLLTVLGRGHRVRVEQGGQPGGPRLALLPLPRLQPEPGPTHAGPVGHRTGGGSLSARHRGRLAPVRAPGWPAAVPRHHRQRLLHLQEHTAENKLPLRRPAAARPPQPSSRHPAQQGQQCGHVLLCGLLPPALLQAALRCGRRRHCRGAGQGEHAAVRSARIRSTAGRTCAAQVGPGAASAAGLHIAGQGGQGLPESG
mmetsp:Transcript_34461/g.75968  ORF Transcript_34461/g.75968 Transcript_34461/m.75968 type:complete len:220 (-) Transcript_34461:617-1276(-)